jgi:hypothetical protein
MSPVDDVIVRFGLFTDPEISAAFVVMFALLSAVTLTLMMLPAAELEPVTVTLLASLNRLMFDPDKDSVTLSLVLAFTCDAELDKLILPLLEETVSVAASAEPETSAFIVVMFALVTALRSITTALVGAKVMLLILTLSLLVVTLTLFAEIERSTEAPVVALTWDAVVRKLMSPVVETAVRFGTVIEPDMSAALVVMLAMLSAVALMFNVLVPTALTPVTVRLLLSEFRFTFVPVRFKLISPDVVAVT